MVRATMIRTIDLDASLADVLPGVDLQVSKTGYQSVRHPLSARMTDITITLLRPDPTVDAITGCVLDAHGALVAGAHVAAGQAATLTDERGEFALQRAAIAEGAELVAIGKQQLPGRAPVPKGGALRRAAARRRRADALRHGGGSRRQWPARLQSLGCRSHPLRHRRPVDGHRRRHGGQRQNPRRDGARLHRLRDPVRPRTQPAATPGPRLELLPNRRHRRVPHRRSDGTHLPRASLARMHAAVG